MNTFLRLQNLISKQTSKPVEQITLDTLLTVDLELDSLSAIELIVEVEKEFGVSFSPEEMEDVQTVGDVVECLRVKIDQGETK